MHKFSYFFALACVVQAAYAVERVQVTVYYESLCPDSIKFFTQQLYPALQGNLSKYVNLQLLPYGKSSQSFLDNQYQFVCHHGPKECLGNKIQACALKLIDRGVPSQDLGFNRNSVGFINCLMDKVVRDGENTKFPTKDCAEINHVSNLIEIENCANHVDGSNYLANLGTLTSALKPALKSVPTIVFNRVFKKEDNDLSQTNYIKALCQYIEGEKPAECHASSASTLKLSFSALAVLFAIFLRFY